MQKLYDVTWNEVSSVLIDKISASYSLSRSDARKLILNALLRNVVIDEISNMVRYILEDN